jgi:SAM-dependent methyltransferase
MANYSLSNAWENARQRLALLEQYLDPITQRRLSDLGLGKGWHCLEVGGGGGSVARWLCTQVGADGRVVGTDIDPRFLDAIREPNFEAWKHDITVDPLPTSEFDLVHTRWLLQHLADPEPAIARMITALRPGGWLLVEGMDFFPIHTASSQPYIDLIVGLANVIASAGGNDFAGRALPAIVAKQGLIDMQAEGDFAILNGGSPMAQFFQLSVFQVRDRIIGSGSVSAMQFDAAIALLEDPAFWAFGPAGVAVRGRKPH